MLLSCLLCVGQATALADGTQSGKAVTVKMKADTGFLTPHVFQSNYGTTHTDSGAGGGDTADEFIQGPQWWSAPAEDGSTTLMGQGFETFNATTMAGSHYGNVGEFFIENVDMMIVYPAVFTLTSNDVP